ncbi:GNAT family N-acetyltransferase [Micromonospora aurantiaca (nom. illeg.)]|uniref:GNAT family N-acetyltransferase n=1 Tax=Micromonospora aurantiaca (nom. illeg.) TaxID=47850 RepID=UPI0033F1CC82
MTFDFIEKRPGPGDQVIWYPFAENSDFSPSWWDYRSIDGVKSYALLEVRQGGVEVARIELDPGVVIDHYLGTPELGNAALEIELIEVAESHRRRGIGTKIIGALASRYPERRLLAFSEEADDFWASLGWTRYDHPEGPQLNRPLYIQPAEGSE